MSSGELTKEQLLDYVKKQKLKIKKLDAEIATLKANADATKPDAKNSDVSQTADESTIITDLSTVLFSSQEQIGKLWGGQTDQDRVIADLKKQLEERDKSIKEQTSQLKTSKDEVAACKRLLQAKNKEIIALKDAGNNGKTGDQVSILEELKVARASCANLTKEKDELQKLLDTKSGGGSDELQASKEMCEKLTIELDESKKTCVKLTADLQSLLETAQSENEELHKALAKQTGDIGVELKESKLMCSKLSNELNDLSKSAEIEKEKYEKLLAEQKTEKEEEIQSLKQMCDKLTSDLDELKKTSDNDTKKFEKMLSEQKTEMEEEVQSLKQMCDKLTSDLNELKKSSENEKNKLQSTLAEQTENLTKDLERSKESCANLEAKLAQQSQSSESSSSTLLQLQEELQKVNISHGEQVDALKKENEESLKKLSDLHAADVAQLERLRNEHETLTKEHADNLAALEVAQNETNALQQKHDEAVAQLGSNEVAKEKANELQNFELARLQEELRAVQENNKDLQEKLDNINSQKLLLEKECAATTEQLEKSKKDIDELKAARTNSPPGATNGVSNGKETDTPAETVPAASTTGGSKNSKKKKKGKANQQSMSAASTDAADPCTESPVPLDAKSIDPSDSSTPIPAVTTGQDLSAEKISELQASLTAAEEKIKVFETEKEESIRQIEEYKAQVATAAAEHISVQSALHAAQKDAAAKEESISELKQQHAQTVADLTKQLEESLATSAVLNANAGNNVAAIQEDHANKQKALKDELSSLENEKTTLEGTIESLTDSLTKIQAEVTQLNEKLAESTASYDKAVADLKELKSDHEAQLETLRNEHTLALQEKNATVAALETNIQSLNEMVEQSGDAERKSVVQLTDQLSAAQTAAQEAQVAHEKEISTLQTELASLKESHNELQETISKSTSQCEQLQAQLDESAKELTELSAKHSTVVAENQGNATALSEQLQNAQADLVLKDASLAEITAKLNALEEEHTKQSEALKESESMNKKLKASLKNKMKELLDATATLNTMKEAAESSSTQSSSHASALSELEGRIQVYQNQIKELEKGSELQASQRAESEAKLKAVNESIMQGEEKISALLREKNALQEETYAAVRKAENAVRESTAVKEEKDKMIEEKVALERRLHSAETAARNKERELEEKIEELQIAAAKRKAELSEVKDALTEAEVIVAQQKETQRLVKEQKADLKALTEHMKTLKTQQEKDKEEFAALQKKEREEYTTKYEAANEKIKRLKSLLQKVNNMAQDKEAKMGQLLHLTDRAKRFGIVSRLSVSLPDGGEMPSLQYCLIYEDTAPHSNGASSAAGAGGEKSAAGSSSTADATAVLSATVGGSRYRWIEERFVRQWLDEHGSSLIGSWPESVTDSWQTRMQDAVAQLEKERDDTAAKLEEVTANFQTYKVRAQTALKRMGNDDRNDRQELEALKENVTELEDKIAHLSRELSERSIAADEQSSRANKFETRVIELEAQLSQAQTQLQQSKEETAQLNEKIQAMETEAEQLQMQISTLENSRLARMSVTATPYAATLSEVLNNNDTTIPSTPLNNTTMSRTPSNQRVDDIGINKDILNESTMSNNNDDPEVSSPAAAISADTSRGVSPAALPPIPASDTKTQTTGLPVLPASPSVSAGGGGKLLFYEQADNVRQDAVLMLRQENSNLSMEILEIKKDIGFRDDQVMTLKSTIRELEASILREKEFNAANRRINAEYLVNVLRKFLLSENPNERSKLVSVICTILHLQPDEAKAIGEKWKVKAPTGLVGWLLPPRPPPVTSTSALRGDDDDSIVVLPESMSMQRGGAKAAGPPGSDLSYNASTGSGIGAGLDIYG